MAGQVRHSPAPIRVAYAVQSIAPLAALFLVVAACVSRAPRRVRYAVLMLAGIFATSYIQSYDLAVVALVPPWLLRGDHATSSGAAVKSWPGSACAKENMGDRAKPCHDEGTTIAWVSSLPLSTPLTAPIIVLLAGVTLAPPLLLPGLYVAMRLALRDWPGGGRLKIAWGTSTC